MKAGFNLLLWTSHVTEQHFPLLQKLKKAGYDGVEIPILEGTPSHYAKVLKAVRDNGLACAVVTNMPDAAHNPVSPEKKPAGQCAGFHEEGHRLHACAGN